MGKVSKDAVLEFVDELESGEEVALKVSHEKDMGAWVSAICEYLEGVEGAVLIGVLLGGFRVEQRGGFYGQEIWVG